MLLGIAVVVVVLAAELWLRWGMGLGDPPLVRLDPETEYELLPSRTYHRFGNRISINRYGMRGPDHAAIPAADERRVLLVGDSVVYGNHSLDQDETIAAALTRRLATSDELAGCRPLVMPAAVASWGPVNQLGYLRRTGSLGAAISLIVVSAHDLYDVPEPRSDLLPYRLRPSWGAIGDVLTEIAERLHRRLAAGPQAPLETRAAESLAALGEMVDLLDTASAPPVLVYHPTRSELAGSRRAVELEVFAEWARSRDIPFVDLATVASGPDGYRDDIHPDAAGAARIVEELAGIVVQRVPGCASP